MIPFFRRFRQRLLTENKFSKYLLYAIGEIILVMIGILLALQVTNWNEKRKNEIIGNQSALKLYEEITNSKKSIDVALMNMDRQINYINQLLSEDIIIDDFISQGQDYWAVEQFSMVTYILFFTEVYNLSTQQYDSAISDGSINLVTSNEFVEILESIQLSNTFLENMVLREIQSNDKIEEYIANNYKDIYDVRKISINGNWNLDTSKEIIKRITADGGVKFLLQQKQTKLKSKKIILQKQILSKIEKAIKVYKNSYLSPI